ncbi:NAD(P)/FAD-dependent oxidoreductase [Corallincola platygyrae]
MVLLEKNDYIGGHTATVDVTLEGTEYAVDTGFIVFNDRTYPNFIKLISQLGVESKPTEMSFSVSNQATGLEYNGHDLNTLFAQRSNLLSPKFYKFLYEIMRFNRLCKGAVTKQMPVVTLGDFLAHHGFSEYFQQHYILPMGAAIWSTSIAGMRDFPLEFFLKFFLNHGLLDVANRPQWYVIKGGSRSYVEPLLNASNAEVRTGVKIAKVTRGTSDATLTYVDGAEEAYDEVVFACHSDETLALLEDATAAEKAILSDLKYKDNEVILHTDTRLLPENKRAWASWNYLLGAGDDALPQLTYNMNILQGLSSKHTFCVSLNAKDKIAPEKILRSFNYAHPQYTTSAAAAQQRWNEISGVGHTHFCGAYWFNGFHEDGVSSALRVAEAFGERL